MNTQEANDLLNGLYRIRTEIYNTSKFQLGTNMGVDTGGPLLVYNELENKFMCNYDCDRVDHSTGIEASSSELIYQLADILNLAVKEKYRRILARQLEIVYTQLLEDRLSED